MLGSLPGQRLPPHPRGRGQGPPEASGGGGQPAESADCGAGGGEQGPPGRDGRHEGAARYSSSQTGPFSKGLFDASIIYSHPSSSTSTVSCGHSEQDFRSSRELTFCCYTLVYLARKDSVIKEKIEMCTQTDDPEVVLCSRSAGSQVLGLLSFLYLLKKKLNHVRRQVFRCWLID